MTSADELALSVYIPLIILLSVTELALWMRSSTSEEWNKKFAVGKLLLNMSWTCTLFPLFLDIDLLTRMIDSLYEGRPHTASPLSEHRVGWLSGLLVFLFFTVNTIDVHEGFQLADKPSEEE